MEHLKKVLTEQGEDAAVEERRRMFAPGGTLPPIEKRHREQAAAYNRWHPSGEAKAERHADTNVSETPQPASE